jgi:hypothetical protein
MDQPVRGFLRAASPGGLTSPEPVTRPHGPSGHQQARRLRNKDKPQNSQRQDRHVPEHNQDHKLLPGARKMITRIYAVD